MLNSTSKPYQVKTKKYVSLYLFLVCLILLTLPACGGGGSDAGVESGNGIHEIPMEAVGLKKEWIYPTGGKIYSSPALAQDGTIYIGSDDGYLYALDPDNGEKIWKFQAQGGIFSSPAIGDYGIIYVGSYDDNLYAIYPEDGTQKWSFSTGDNVLSSPALDNNGIIYVGSNDGKLYAITPEGEEKWSVFLGGLVSSPAIGEDNTIYVGAGEINLTSPAKTIGRLYARGPNGEKKWEKEFNVFSRPAIGTDGTIYAGSTNKNLYALDPDNGEEIWKYTTGGPILSSPNVLEWEPDIIIIGSDDENLYAFNSEGEIIWNAQLGDKIRSSAETGPDGTIYIGCHDYCLHSFDAEDGAHIGQYPTGESVTSIPAVSNDGTIYFGSQDKKIYALTRIPGGN